MEKPWKNRHPPKLGPVQSWCGRKVHLGDHEIAWKFRENLRENLEESIKYPDVPYDFPEAKDLTSKLENLKGYPVNSSEYIPHRMLKTVRSLRL